MAAPAITDFTLYTNKLLNATDWQTNWQVVVNILTNGAYDLTANSLKTTGNISVGGAVAITGAATIGGALTVTGACTAASFTGDGSALTGISLQGRNYITNGNGIVFQRAASFALTAGTQGFGCDRWQSIVAGATTITLGSFTQSAAAPIGVTGHAMFVDNLTTTGAGSKLNILTRIESKDAVNLYNTFSSFNCIVYHNCGVAKNYKIYIESADVADDFSAVTQVSASASLPVLDITATYIKLENVNMGGVAVKNGIQIRIEATVGAVTAKDFYLTEAQMEVGSVATTYEHKFYGVELQNCLRYFETILAEANRTYVTAGLAYKIDEAAFCIPIYPKRTPPTITSVGSNLSVGYQAAGSITYADFGAGTAGSVPQSSKTMGQLTGKAAVGAPLTAGQAVILSIETSGGYIAFSAEI